MRKISAQMLRRIIQTEANKLLREGKVDQADKVFNSASALLKAIQKFEETATQNQVNSLSNQINEMKENLTNMKRNYESYFDKPENSVIIGGK
jgi:hypothetical protein